MMNSRTNLHTPWIIARYVVMLFGCCMLLFSCETSTRADKPISKTELAQMIEKGEVTVLDVRTPEEVAAGMIPGAIHMDFYADDFDTQLANLPKDKPVVTYCKSGGRAGQALDKLKALGHKNVHNFGGFDNWMKK